MFYKKKKKILQTTSLSLKTGMLSSLASSGQFFAVRQNMLAENISPEEIMRKFPKRVTMEPW